MPCSDKGPDLPRDHSGLEDWLQPPESNELPVNGEASTSPAPPEEDTASPSEAIHPDAEELFPPKPPAAQQTEEPAEREKSDQEGPGEELVRLRRLLAQEFGDTLSGANALTAPVGILLLIFALLGWFSGPLLGFLEVRWLLENHGWTIYVSAAVLTLTALHLLFYWAVHRVSNAVKTRELDRIVLRRRVDTPCRHLDCLESEAGATLTQGETGSENVGGLETNLKWRCGLFDVDLEGFPLCAVCSRYEAREEASMII
jgi:hypothetical protein